MAGSNCELSPAAIFADLMGDLVAVAQDLAKIQRRMARQLNTDPGDASLDKRPLHLRDCARIIAAQLAAARQSTDTAHLCAQRAWLGAGGRPAEIIVAPAHRDVVESAAAELEAVARFCRGETDLLTSPAVNLTLAEDMLACSGIIGENDIRFARRRFTQGARLRQAAARSRRRARASSGRG